ncbi:MAG: hypothetical protein NTY30_03505 [Candidatus Berkelbacteria bacterium]|nr:hypothetical protein [Candidatus Berkelbacteria bacterium]
MGFDEIKNITITFLSELSKFADEIIEPMTLSGMRKRVYYPEWNNRKFDSNVRSLEHRGFIKIDRKSDSIELTNKGRIKVIENSSEKIIDGKWRFLSWDIPEKFSVKRQSLCRSVRRIGYKQVQKSLWTCPFAKANQVDLIIKDLGLEKYVAFLLVEKTDIEGHLKQLFKKDLVK